MRAKACSTSWSSRPSPASLKASCRLAYASWSSPEAKPGAVVSALGVRRLRIGPQIDPGVPWTESLDDPPLALALKSGNFGSPDFFEKALAQLE